ncbi:DNA polymerase III subunit delta [Actinoalloteichus sp. AHMU CJ021]|uniref:DNA-directed DNA polymerase n=1 Tax=Actinoalloteichus caeruleus DSM 43889 TaxID=1120930 RepID=A0ABT1JPD7_ACTCY|nr:hypothetical protein [Actinoalloteichus caeruleus]AUS80031.1 DNA polymerase III subunit delta [Actinoalloteichus sp. AHMU CJ021]MCP2334217.1 DNA polymerase III, delta subunit [Actinoalloteichus caeruleus DSM 43889]
MPPQPAPPAPLQLILGDEELLVERATRETLRQLRVAEPMAELTRLRATELTPPHLAELVSPSLFAEARVVVLEAAQEAGAEICEAVAAYCRAPAEGVVLVVVHSGGGRSKLAKQLPATLRSAGAEVTECPKVTKASDREAFVRNEVRVAGGRIDAAGVHALIEAVGSDLRELASAAAQLVSDHDGPLDEATVRRYHRGRAEVTGFAVAERAVVGDVPGALEALRWALSLGVPHVLVADALADAVRSVALVRGAGGGDPFRLAGQLGMPPWKVKKVRNQIRGWEDDSLVRAMRVVATLNGEVKGQAADASYALERAVLEVARAQRAGQRAR